jgi:hypothetical protein
MLPEALEVMETVGVELDVIAMVISFEVAEVIVGH